MKSIALICATSCGAALAASAGLRVSTLPDDANRAITHNYASLTKAFVANDFKSFAAFLTNDFVAIDPDYKTTARDRAIKDFKTQRGRLNHVEWVKKLKGTTLAKVGHHVIAQVLVDSYMTAYIDFADYKMHTFVLDATSRDEWVRAGGAWKLRKSQTMGFIVKVDDQLVTR